MTAMQKTTQEELRRLVEQIERLEEEKAGIAADIKDKLVEAKNKGFDTKIMKKVLALRRKSAYEREEEDALLDTYLAALGMLSGDDTPLGKHWSDTDGEEARA